MRSRKVQGGPAAPPNADYQWKMAQGSKPLRRSSTTREAEPRPAPPLAVVRHAAWKAAISAAADWRETAAAGAAGAS